MREALSLYELNHQVATLVGRGLPGCYWVRAELAEARERSGHCYMDLVEKSPGMNTPVARASAKCWRSTWAVLGPAFERATGQRMHAGMKVMLMVHAQFHETYGFSWIVDDIDPSYTLGDMERKRQEIVRKLKEEGVFDLQKHLDLPLFCQRVAVVSTATAAGYGDFCNQLGVNDYGLVFHTELFEAVMQGEQVETSVVGALNRICRRQDDFDVVVIIRGGGGKADLSGFDTLVLGENVANFPLPIITGIGHDRDESIIDMVSFLRVKTPTAAAAYLVDHLSAVYARVEDCRLRMANSVRRRMEREAERLRRIVGQLPTAFGMVKARREAAVDRLWARLDASARRTVADRRHHTALLADRIGPSARRIVDNRRHHLALLADRIAPAVQRIVTARRHGLEMIGVRLEALDPQRVLQRGYSITLHEGRAVRDAADVKPGDVIVTRVAAGTVESVVTKKDDTTKTT